MAREGRDERPLGLTLIAIGKLVKVVVLLTVGVLAIAMAGKNLPEALVHWANVLRIDENNRLLHRAIEGVAGVSSKKLQRIGFGTFVYAALFAIEGLGLWMQRRWAEYLTIGITLSFIPLEIYELARHVSWARITALVLNVAVLVYLVILVARARNSERGRPDSAKPSAARGTV